TCGASAESIGVVEDRLHEFLDSGAADVLVVETRDRPTVIERERSAISVGLGLSATRIKIAGVGLTPEDVTADAAANEQRQDLRLGIVCSARDFIHLIVAASEKLHAVAVARQPVHAPLRADSSLEVAEECGVRAIGLLPKQKKECEFVLDRIDDAAPPFGAIGPEHDRRCVRVAFGGRSVLRPVTEDRLIRLAFAAE